MKIMIDKCFSRLLILFIEHGISSRTKDQNTNLVIVGHGPGLPALVRSRGWCFDEDVGPVAESSV